MIPTCLWKPRPPGESVRGRRRPGVLDRPSRRPDTGATQPGGPAGWSTGTLGLCPDGQIVLLRSLYRPQRARTTPPGAQTDKTLSARSPGTPSSHRGSRVARLVTGCFNSVGSRYKTRDANLRVTRSGGARGQGSATVHAVIRASPHRGLEAQSVRHGMAWDDGGGNRIAEHVGGCVRMLT